MTRGPDEGWRTVRPQYLCSGVVHLRGEAWHGGAYPCSGVVYIRIVAMFLSERRMHSPDHGHARSNGRRDASASTTPTPGCAGASSARGLHHQYRRHDAKMVGACMEAFGTFLCGDFSNIPHNTAPHNITPTHQATPHHRTTPRWRHIRTHARLYDALPGPTIAFTRRSTGWASHLSIYVKRQDYR